MERDLWSRLAPVSGCRWWHRQLPTICWLFPRQRIPSYRHSSREEDGWRHAVATSPPQGYVSNRREMSFLTKGLAGCPPRHPAWSALEPTKLSCARKVLTHFHCSSGKEQERIVHMLSHIDAPQQGVSLTSTTPSGCCQNPADCANRTAWLEQYMLQVMDQAQQSFFALISSDRLRIIASDILADKVDQFGVSWRELATSVRLGMIVEWYDSCSFPDVLQPLPRKQAPRTHHTYQVTLRDRGRLRPKTVLDMASRCEFFLNQPRRYSIILRCELARRTPLVVICTYGEPSSSGAVWPLQIVGALDPSAQPGKWGANYTRRICLCVDERQESPIGNWTTIFHMSAQRHF